jgi:hypothetical protein
MASLERMTSLSTGIAKNTQILTDYLKSKGRDAPSFDVDGLDSFPIDPSDGEAVKARMELVSMTKELHDIALGPKEGLRYLSWDVSLILMFVGRLGRV